MLAAHKIMRLILLIFLYYACGQALLLGGHHAEVQSPPLDLINRSDLEVIWVDQHLDHFRITHEEDQKVFKQRVFVYSKYYKRARKNNKIFFYFGNEGELWRFEGQDTYL